MKIRNANERQTILQSLAFSISSKANDAANQADNIVASMIVDVELIMVQRELLTYSPCKQCNAAIDVSSPLEIGYHNAINVI